MQLWAVRIKPYRRKMLVTCNTGRTAHAYSVCGMRIARDMVRAIAEVVQDSVQLCAVPPPAGGGYPLPRPTRLMVSTPSTDGRRTQFSGPKVMKVCSKCHQQKAEDHFRKASNKQCIGCIEKVRCAQRADPEGEKARKKLYVERHPERVKAQVTKWKRANPAKIRAYDKVQRLKNPRYRELRNLRKRVRNIRRREDIYNRDEGRCGICSKRVPFNRMTLDHIIPRSAGGKDTEDNLRLAHMMCNSRRQDKGSAQIRMSMA